MRLLSMLKCTMTAVARVWLRQLWSAHTQLGDNMRCTAESRPDVTTLQYPNGYIRDGAFTNTRARPTTPTAANAGHQHVVLLGLPLETERHQGECTDRHQNSQGQLLPPRRSLIAKKQRAAPICLVTICWQQMAAK